MTQDIQFYIQKLVPEKDLVDYLSIATGIELETLDYPNDSAVGFVMITQYDKGFRLGVNITWPDSLNANINYLEVANTLSKQYQTLIATDPPPDLEGSMNQDPYVWYVSFPNGESKLYNQSTSDEDGLVLSKQIM